MVIPPIIQVGDVLVSGDIIERKFCCDLDVCRGACCVEGDAGAPVTLDEIAAIEDRLDDVWHLLSASAQSVIDRQGVAYADPEGELVTSIVRGRDCVFTCQAHGIDGLPDGCCICALESVARSRGDERFVKPVSCALYPIREKNIGGTVCLNYHRWDICRCAERKGTELNLPVYKFLKEPLIRRFGAEWYAELESVAQALTATE